MRFRAKSSMIPPGEGGLLSAPPSRSSHGRSLWFKGIMLVALLWLLLWGMFSVLNFSGQGVVRRYPKAHPAGSKEIVKTSLRFLYPAIEDVPVLQQMGIYSLFTRLGGDLVSLNFLDEDDPVKQKAKEAAFNAELQDNQVKNNFKNRRKLQYDSTHSGNSPRVVIVTALDYEKYSLQSLVNLVQNRVDYAINYDYGVYVRWTQEFVAEMNDFEFTSNKEKAKWVRLFALRAAMFAFPHAEWFWYLDQDSLIMNKDVDIANYLLAPSSIEAAMMRDKPLIPPTGIIKTYDKMDPENVKLIFTQSKQKIETGSFLMKNDAVGRGILDTWQDKLYMQYNNFPFGPDSAITHILQWHPFMLSKTILIPARMISSMHNPLVSEDQRETDPLNYYPGDLVAQWIECNSEDSCETILNSYWDKIPK